jgi:hypothetical protein
VGLGRDRDQLFAEAYQASLLVVPQAKAGREIVWLPEELWAAATAEQEARRHCDPLEEILTDALEGKEGFIPTIELERMLGVVDPSKRRTVRDVIARTLERMNWVPARRTAHAGNGTGAIGKSRGYAKGTSQAWHVYATHHAPGDAAKLSLCPVFGVGGPEICPL